MRVMVVGPTDPDSFADNVGSTLARMGHQTLLAGPVRKGAKSRFIRNGLEILSEKLSKLDEFQQRHLASIAIDFAPDAIITVDRRLNQAMVADLVKVAPVGLWFPDAVSSMGRHDMFLAPYTKLYLKNPTLVDRLRRVNGLNVTYLPEAANAIWHRPLVDYGSRPEIVMAGNLHPTRVLLLQRLIAAGIPIVCFGSQLPRWISAPTVSSVHQGTQVYREQKAHTFRAARGVLNNLHPAEYAGANCRLFEAAGCGSAVLTEWRDGMDSLFTRDVEALAFESFEELLELCTRLLDDIDFGREVADAAAARVAAEHTYEHRLVRILSDLTAGPAVSGGQI